MPTGVRYVLLAAVLFGTTGTTQALGPDGTDPLTVGAVRLAIGAAGLLVAAVPGGGLRQALSAPAGAIVMAVAGVAGYQVTFFGGVRLAGVAVGTLVTIGSAPLFTAVVARVVSGERPVRGWWPATSVAVAGLALIAGPAGGADATGIVLALAAGLAYALFSVGSAGVIATSSPAGAMAAVFAGGAVLLLPLLVLGDLGWVGSPAGAAAALWLGLGATTLAYVFYGRGLATTPVTTVATLVLLEPVTALLLAVVVLRERPPAAGFSGAALVIAGLLALARRPSSPSGLLPPA